MLQKFIHFTLIFVVCFVVPHYFKQITNVDGYLKIVGGIAAEADEFPYMVTLHHLNGVLFCGGALISKYYILTAAHCVDKKLANNILIRLGNYEENTSKRATYIYINVSRIIQHEKFHMGATSHDLALLRLAQKAPRTQFIIPICLPYTKNTFEGENAKIAGWGLTSVDGYPVNFLHKLEMTILSQEDCCNHLDDECSVVLSEEKMCAFSEGKGACKSDSGGPLVWEDPRTKKPQLVGIISMGLCGKRNLPGIFTRISSYLDWIQKNTIVDNSICWI